MEISVKDFSEMKAIMSSLTKTIKNFDDRLNEVENNVGDIAETVTVELPKAIAEQVEAAVGTAVEESNNEEANAPVVEETAVAEETVAPEEAPAEGEPCPECGNTPCTCENADGNFCGDGQSFEEFSQKVTETIEDLTVKANDIAERVNKMFIKVFSEGDDQINDVTDGEEDVQKVEESLKEDPKEFVTEEEPQITDEKKPEVKAEVVVAAPVVEAPAVAPVETPKEEEKQFSEKRYETVKNIFNL